MFQFANPIYLYFIGPVVLCYFIFSFREKSKLKRFKEELGESMAPLLTSSYSLTRSRWKLRLLCLSIIFFLLALARPQMGQGEKEVATTGIEMILAVDVSTSMLAEDVKPSRLDFLKRELGLLLDRLSGDKVGLVVFAGSSVLVSPLTTDYSALKMFIDGLSPESVSSQGTVFANAIDESLDAFKRGGIESDEDIRVSRALLIASDGEDNEEGALAAAKKAREEGMFTFSLGFGTEKGGSIPIRDERGYLKGYKKDRSGNIIVTKAKTDLLRKISEAGGGRHYHAVVGGAHLDALLRDIDNLEKAKFNSSVAKDYNEYFQWPLFVGVILLFMERWIANRRKESKVWKGRINAAEVSS
jgi:Ca-activated chloride channel family protein